MNALISDALVYQLSTVTAGAAGTSAINSSEVDLQGAEGVLFIIPVGAIVSGGVTSVKVQHNDVTATGQADVLGTSQSIADTADDTTIYIHLRKPVKRFARVVVSRATQNATIGGIVAVVYGIRTGPVTQTLTGESHVSPASGTA